MSRLALLFLLFLNFVRSQDIFANVIVNSELVRQTNKSVFINLEKEITNFVNNNSWSGNYYSNNEKLKVNILINVLSFNNNKFLANFEFQSTRPVFNSSFITPVFNYVDKNVEFNFEEYETLYFIENQFQSNLVSLISFYMFIISGIDNDCFKLKSGDRYYDKAQEVLNLASQGNLSRSWQPSSNDGRMNKFWLVENISSENSVEFRNMLFNYHVNGMDLLSDNIAQAKLNISESIIDLEKMNRRTPNSNLIRIFFETKSDEIKEIFSSGPEFDTSILFSQLNRIAPFFSSKWKSFQN